MTAKPCSVSHDGVSDGDVPGRIFLVLMGAAGPAYVIHEK